MKKEKWYHIIFSTADFKINSSNYYVRVEFNRQTNARKFPRQIVHKLITILEFERTMLEPVHLRGSHDVGRTCDTFNQHSLRDWNVMTKRTIGLIAPALSGEHDFVFCPFLFQEAINLCTRALLCVSSVEFQILGCLGIEKKPPTSVTSRCSSWNEI